MRVALVLMAAALVAAPAPAKPKIKDVQFSYGQLGPERKSAEFVRGDELYARFTVTGFSTNEDGRLVGELAFTVTDDKKKEWVKKAVPMQQPLALGGGAFPGHVTITLGAELPAGEYTLSVTVTDNLSKASDSSDKKFTCKPEEFALVGMRFFQDPDGKVPAPVGGIVSQSLFFKARGVGFDRSKGELDLEMTIQVFDAAGKPMMPKPIRSVVHNEDPNVVKSATVINLRGELALNRAGEFVLKVSLTDRQAKKTVTFEAPMKVTSP
jgi:hypothetical protein